MPINNNLFGVYKSFLLSGNKVVAQSVSRNRQMDASPVNYVQGTPKARVMDIKGVTETLTVQAPLFVGSGSSVDGRYIANTKIEEILNPQTASLPLLSSAQFQIGAEEASVSLTLESDGDPNNLAAFSISSNEIEELNPDNGPTRLAKFYDFRVQIGKRKYFIMSANLTVTAQTDKKYFFIPGDWDDYRGWGNPEYGYPSIETNPDITGTGSTNIIIEREGGSAIEFQPGTQFPFLGISGIQIAGSGQAAVLLEDLNSDGSFTDADEAINLSLEPGTTDMTLQDPGYSRYENAQFRIEIFDPAYYDAYPAGMGWTSFLTPQIDTSKSIVNTSNFSLTPGVMTVDFDFICWVK